MRRLSPLPVALRPLAGTPRSRSLLVAALLLALLVGLAGPGPARAAKMAKGLQDVRMVYSEDADLRGAFWGAARAAKVTQVRVLVNWDGEAREIDPGFAFRLRRAAEEGRNAGARLLIGIYAPINRARSKPITITSRLIDDYAAFAGSIARVMRGLPVAGYITWNEANFRSMWPLNQPRRWAKLSNAGYRAYKAEAPSVPVLVGELAPNARTSNATEPGAFLRQALCVDRRYRSLSRSRSCRTRLLADGVALHTHDFTRAPTRTRSNRDSWTMGNLRYAKAELRALARAKRLSSAAARNVHITEFAYRTAGSQRTPIARAARYLRQAWAFARREGVRSFTWYQLRDPGRGHEWQSGLLTNAGRSRATWRTFRGLR